MDSHDETEGGERWCWWVEEAKFRAEMPIVISVSAILNSAKRTADYSPLLHMAILSIGVVYTDRDSTERETLSLQFARSARPLFEDEIELAQLSSVVGLMLLGSSHAGHARQGLGYIYTGIGLRLTRISQSSPSHAGV